MDAQVLSTKANSYSDTRRDMLDLILVVLLMGFLSNVIANYFDPDFIRANVIFIILILLVATGIISYFLVLTPHTIEARIYANVMIDEKNKTVYSPPYCAPAMQWAYLFWKALQNDGSPLAQALLSDLEDHNRNEVVCDLLQYMVLLAVNNMDVFWGSSRISHYGSPAAGPEPMELGEVLVYHPTAVLTMECTNLQTESTRKLKYLDINDAVKGNQIIQHFSSKSCVDPSFRPDNWICYAPWDTGLRGSEHNEND